MDAHGELVGINTFIISNNGSFAGAGFAIPSQIVRASAESIIKDGTVHHGYLGISMNDVTPDNSSFFNLPDATGAIVSQVTPDSPAGRAGLKSGDVLRELNGSKIVNGSASASCGEPDCAGERNQAGHFARWQAGNDRCEGGRIQGRQAGRGQRQRRITAGWKAGSCCRRPDTGYASADEHSVASERRGDCRVFVRPALRTTPVWHPET